MAGGRASETDTLPTVGFSYLVVARASRGNANISSAPAPPAITAQSSAECRSAVPEVISSARSQGMSGPASQGHRWDPWTSMRVGLRLAQVYRCLGLARNCLPGAHVEALTGGMKPTVIKAFETLSLTP